MKNFLFCLITVFGYESFGQSPEPRHLEEIAYDHNRQRLIVFGGVEFGASSVDYPSNIFEWSEKNQWQSYDGLSVGNRYAGAVIYHPKEKLIYILGGNRNIEGVPKVNHEIWTWDGIHSKLINETVPVKSPEAVYDLSDDRILVYGDANDLETPGGLSNNTSYQLWSFKAGIWQKLSETGPKILVQYEMAFDEHRGVLVLPVWENNVLTVWEWSDNKWNQKKCSGDYPSSRNRYVMTYDPGEKLCFLFGGRNSEHPFMNDLWSWNGMAWSKIVSKNVPEIRAAASMEYGSGGLLLYGGVVPWGHSNELWLWKNKRWTLLNENDAMNADRYMQRTLERTVAKPDDAGAWREYGSILKYLKKYDDAEFAYTRAYRLMPAEHNILFDLCNLLLQQNKNLQAEQKTDSAIEANLFSANALSRLGMQFYSIKRHSLAIKCLEKSLAKEVNAGNLYNLACNYALNHNADKAFELLNQYINLGNGNKQQIEGDDDLKPLYADQRWALLLGRLKQE